MSAKWAAAMRRRLQVSCTGRRVGLLAASGAAAAMSSAAPAEAQHAREDGADIMGAVMATTVASLIAAEYAIQAFEVPPAGPASQSSTKPLTKVHAPPPRPAQVSSVQPATAVVPEQHQPNPPKQAQPKPSPAYGVLSTWPAVCMVLGVVATAAAVRTSRQPAVKRQVSRPLWAQTSVTVSERHALRRARNEMWYSRIARREELHSGAAVVAGARKPQLWCGHGDLLPSPTAGPATRSDYSVHDLPSLVRQDVVSRNLIASLAALPARGVERTHSTKTPAATSHRSVGPRTPILAKPEPTPTLDTEYATPASDMASKAASVAILRDLADVLSAQRGILATLFAEVDEDGSVSLDKDELRELITHKLGVGLTNSEMETVWSQLDVDGSVSNFCMIICLFVLVYAFYYWLRSETRILRTSQCAAGGYRSVGVSHLGAAYVSNTYGSEP